MVLAEACFERVVLESQQGRGQVLAGKDEAVAEVHSQVGSRFESHYWHHSGQGSRVEDHSR